MSYTVAQILSKMPEAFVPEKASGLEAIIQFKFTGAEAGEWFVTIKDGKCRVDPGHVPAPKLTVSADSGDFARIITGEMDGMQAFMQGKLKLAGDFNLATKLLTLFKIR
jgi:putative sterol carrier protein